jgi:hypothetical protein
MVYTEEERKEKQRESWRRYRKTEKYKKNQEIIREKENERKSKYKKTERGKKSTCKTNWKKRGLNMENFEEIYERYRMAIFCDICECVLDGIGYNQKCMDHDHETGEFRNIVCRGCNIHICK